MRKNMVRLVLKWARLLIPVAALIVLLATAYDLNRRPVPAAQNTAGTTTHSTQQTTQATEETTEATEATEITESTEATESTETTESTEATEATTEATDETTQPTEATQATIDRDGRKLVVIDAGHQAKGNSKKEPDGPGSSTMKAKVSSGTTGVATGLPEYKLNLQVALKLQKLLEARGYQVVMIRTTNDVNISNAERAQVANDLQADAFIRIHANGSSNSDAHGTLTICQTKKNPYNKELYAQSRLLAESVLDELTEAAGSKRLYIWETDTMSGINWCQVPTTIVEMGFMSNAEEDRKMATDSYQNKLATGIANGIDRYFDHL